MQRAKPLSNHAPAGKWLITFKIARDHASVIQLLGSKVIAFATSEKQDCGLLECNKDVRSG